MTVNLPHGLSLFSSLQQLCGHPALLSRYCPSCSLCRQCKQAWTYGKGSQGVCTELRAGRECALHVDTTLNFSFHGQGWGWSGTKCIARAVGHLAQVLGHYLVGGLDHLSAHERMDTAPLLLLFLSHPHPILVCRSVSFTCHQRPGLYSCGT